MVVMSAKDRVKSNRKLAKRGTTEPNCAQDLTGMKGPKTFMSKANAAGSRQTRPKTSIASPVRPKERAGREEPACATSKVKALEPALAIPNAGKARPI